MSPALVSRERGERREQFSIPYALEGGSRHARVLDTILQQERNTYDSTQDLTRESFSSAEDYQETFNDIVGGAVGQPVMVSEFYLFDPDDWDDRAALELDYARFDPETRTVYCIETTGKNLHSVGYDEASISRDEKKKRVRTAAREKGEQQLDQLQEYMAREDWRVEGTIAVFYQDGNRGDTHVELHPYTPEVEA